MSESRGVMDPVRWKPNSSDARFPGKIRLIDQTLLPTELRYIEIDTIEKDWDAIKRLVVRGAPAIGIAAAYGLMIGAQNLPDETPPHVFLQEMRKNADYLISSRPTAVNLEWAVNRCVRVVNAAHAQGKADSTRALKAVLMGEGDAVLSEDIAMCRRIGEHGVTLLPQAPSPGILTHCNAGALATGDWGTALSVVYVAQERGLRPRVFSDETRPLLQGSRLTAWELHRAGVDVTVIADNMAAQVMKEGKVQAVFVGADRIAANGDSANKIGTYGVAILARHHGIPFYICAPYSTLDPSIATGAGIVIEQRNPDEIRCAFGKPTAPPDVPVYNPAFDVTPCHLITAIVTEEGILRPPFTESIAQFCAAHSKTKGH